MRPEEPKKCECNPEGLTAEELDAKIRALTWGIIKARGPSHNRSRRCDPLETYRPCSCRGK